MGNCRKLSAHNSGTSKDDDLVFYIPFLRWWKGDYEWLCKEASYCHLLNSASSRIRITLGTWSALRSTNHLVTSNLAISVPVLTHVLLNPDIPCFANSVDPDQLASSEANCNLDLHCLPSGTQIYSNNLFHVIWLAENLKWVWHHNLFSRTRVKMCK